MSLHTLLFYLSILSPGPVPDSPLEVCLGVSLDEGVDGANTTMSLGGVVHGLRCVLRRRCVSGSVPPYSVSWLVCLSLKCEHICTSSMLEMILETL